MAAGTVAGVYAQALLELADERARRAPLVESCLGLLGREGHGGAVLSVSLIAQLDDPRLGKAKAKATIEGSLSGRIEPELIDLLKLLVDRNRLSDAPAILAEVVRIAEQQAGAVKVDVVSATPLSADSRVLVQEALKRALGPGVELTVHIDPVLLGGLTIRVGDVFVDGSIRRKLIELKSRIIDVQLPETLWSA
jgi:F-type H+-transporting ATPase subunit delta